MNGPLFGGAMPALGGPMSPPPQAMSPAGMVPLPYPFGIGLPNALMMGPETMVGVTAPALLAAVAMRRGQPQGPSNDQEVEDFIYDALDLLPGATEVEVRCEAGRVTLTGSVQQKRLKRDVGEISWAIPAVSDVQNTVTIQSRRRTRTATGREPEAPPSGPGRKQG